MAYGDSSYGVSTYGGDPAATAPPPPATGINWSGPASGNIYEASSNFTAQPNGTYTGSILITPSDPDGGTFSPTSATSVDGAAVTFTLTPTTTGAHDQLGITNNGGFSAPAELTYTVATPAATTNDFVALRVFQRSGTSKTITFSGAYTNSTPSSVEVKIVNDADNSTAQDWTALSSASIAAGTYSGTLSVPQGGWYNFLARTKFSGGQVLATSSQTTHNWGVGAQVWIGGQSNGNMLELRGNAYVTPNVCISQYAGSAGTGWTTCVGGQVNIANALNDALGIPVAICNYSVGGSGLDPRFTLSPYNWTAATVGYPYPMMKLGFQSLEGKMELFIWVQGEADNIYSESTYVTNFDTFEVKLRADLGQASLQILVSPLGWLYDDFPGITDASWQGIKNAQLTLAAETNNWFACSTGDLSHDPDTPPEYGIHIDDVGSPVFGTRLGLTSKVALGLAAAGTNRGPSIAGVYRLNTTHLNVKVTPHAGTDITPSSGITGFRVLDNGTPAATSGVARIASNYAQITMAGALSGATGTTTVQYLYGRNPDHSAVMKDNSANALPLELTNTTGFLDSAAAAPSKPAAPVASATGSTTATVVLAAPNDNGAPITGYTVTSSPGGGTDLDAGTTTLTHRMTGLTTGQAYTFTYTATNAVGTSAASDASNEITPNSGIGSQHAHKRALYLKTRWGG